MIHVNSDGGAVITCSEYHDDQVMLDRSCVVSRVHLCVSNERGSALVTMNLQEMAELRDHLDELIKYAS